VNSMVVDFKREIQALRASVAAKNGELKVCKAESEVCKVGVEAYTAWVEALEAHIKVCMVVWPTVEPSKHPPL